MPFRYIRGGIYLTCFIGFVCFSSFVAIVRATPSPVDSQLQAAGEAPPKMIPLGWFSLPENLIVRGALSFDNEDIRQALSQDWKVVMSAHPAINRRSFASLVSLKALEGLYSFGFINARVLASYSGQNLVLQIVEGERAQSARILVKGASKISPDLVKASITSVSSQGPPSCDSSTRGKITREVKRLYSENGYLFSEVAISVRPGKTSTEAVVIVGVTSEGPLCTFDSIHPEGFKDQTVESVQKYCSLTKGEVLTSSRMKQVSDALFNSGRFMSVFVSPDRPEGKAPAKLRISVKELENAPPLQSALTVSQKAMVRLCTWLNGFSSESRELLFSASVPGNIQISGALSSKKGILIDTVKTSEEAFRLLWTAGTFLATDSTVNRKCTIPVLAGQVKVQLHLLPSGEEENPFSMKAGVTYESKRDGSSPIVYDASFAPVAFFGFLSKCTVESAAVENGTYTLSLRRNNTLFSLKIDKDTGRPEDITVKNVDSDKEIFTASAGDDGFQVLESIHNRCGQNATEVYESSRPVASFGEFLGGAIASRLYEKDDMSDAIRKCAVNCMLVPVLDGIDSLVSANDHVSDSRDEAVLEYSIPPDRKPSGGGALFIGPAAILSSASTVFDPYEWPRIFARAILPILGGQPRFSSVWLSKLGSSSSIGPLGYFLIGKTLSLIDRSLAVKCMDRSLEVLSRTGLKLDYDLICSVPPLSKAAESMVKAVSRVSTQDVVDGSQLLMGKDASIVCDLHKKVSEVDPSEPLRDLLMHIFTGDFEKDITRVIIDSRNGLSEKQVPVSE